LAITGLVVSLLGLQWLIVFLYERAVRGVGIRRVLKLNTKGGIDVICTAGHESISVYGASAARRVLTPEGEVHGLSAVATAIGRWYPRTRLHVEMSGRLTHRCNRDLIILGGPAGNQCAGLVFRWPVLNNRIVVDPLYSTVVVGEFRWHGYLHDFVEGRPSRDLCVAVVTRNMWSPGAGNRLVLFAGLTTYGTGAAADLFFSYLRTRGKYHRDIRKLIRGNHTTVMVFEAYFNNGNLWNGHLVAITRL
jgi:hypothetical protein